ncbi:hypothetical protein [Flavobacterium sp.]|uniref:hypothetical protein n=1 Tax=Flavobacterium sp. TaxID=239 RepID=UPI0038FCA7AC
MKNIKFIFGFVFLIALAIGCTVEGIDDDTSFLDSVTAPSNVVAFYNITQDNSGLVTITPNGEGAESYDIYYGDTTATPVNVAQGKSTSHIYPEGTYSVRIIATGITGLKKEVTQSLIVSLKSPENLVVTITNDLVVSKKVNVKATADFATMFDVYFGEPGKTAPVSANIGETASYIYAAAGSYTIKIVSKSAAIKTTDYSTSFVVTEIFQPTISAPTPPLRQAFNVISIYGSKYSNVADSNYFPDWGQGGQGSSWSEFDLNGDKMLNYIKLSYQGINIGSAIDASSMEFLHIDVWSATNMSIDIYPLPDGIIPANERFVTKTLVGNQWNSFDIPMTAFTSQVLPINNLKQFKFVGAPWATGTVFVDNLYFYKGPIESIQMPIDFESNLLTYTWGGFGSATASVIANPDKSGANLSNKVVKIDKASGAEVWAGASLNLGSSVNFTKGTKVSINVWSPKVGANILFKMEDSKSPKDGNGNPSVVVEVVAVTTVANAWQVLTFDLTSFPAFSSANSYDRIIIFPDFGVNGTGTNYYFDDIKQF